MQSDWLKLITWFAKSNQNDLFLTISITLLWNFFMRLTRDIFRVMKLLSHWIINYDPTLSDKRLQPRTDSEEAKNKLGRCVSKINDWLNEWTSLSKYCFTFSCLLAWGLKYFSSRVTLFALFGFESRRAIKFFYNALLATESPKVYIGTNCVCLYWLTTLNVTCWL